MAENAYVPDYRPAQPWRSSAPDKTPANIVKHF